MSSDKSNVATPRPAPKPRNPVERVIVWGFIGLMAVLVVVEAIPWYSHRQALAELNQRLKVAEDDISSKGVHEDDVKAVLGGRQAASVEDLQGQSNSNGAAKREVYNWFTLSPVAKRQIVVYYGYSGKNDKGGAEVLEVQTNEEQRALAVKPIPLTPEEEEAHKKAAETGASPGGMGMGGGGGGGRGQGGGRGKRQRPPAEQEEPKSESASDEARPTTDEPKTEKPDSEPAGTGEEKSEPPADKPAE